jgi:hypothetical protein
MPQITSRAPRCEAQNCGKNWKIWAKKARAKAVRSRFLGLCLAVLATSSCAAFHMRKIISRHVEKIANFFSDFEFMHMGTFSWHDWRTNARNLCFNANNHNDSVIDVVLRIRKIFSVHEKEQTGEKNTFERSTTAF